MWSRKFAQMHKNMAYVVMGLWVMAYDWWLNVSEDLQIVVREALDIMG